MAGRRVDHPLSGHGIDAAVGECRAITPRSRAVTLNEHCLV